MTQTNPLVNDSYRKRSKAKSMVNDLLDRLTPDDCLKNPHVDDLPFGTIVLQQSLLTPIISHILTSLELTCNEDWDCYDADSVKEQLPYLIENVGYVSDNLSVDDEDLPELISFASFFGAEVRSIFLEVNPSQFEDFAEYSQIITGLSFTYECIEDFDFLKLSSSICLPNLRILECGNFMDAEIGEGILDGVIVLAEALKTKSTITSVELSGNFIGDEGIIALADALKYKSTISMINLGNNAIDIEGGFALAEALKFNSSINSLYLDCNCIGAEGAVALAETSICMIIPWEVKESLANALKTNSTVTEIHLGNNVIYDDGAFAFADMLKINSTLTKLDLSGNPLGPEGATALAEVMEVNSSITEIDVTVNCVDFRLAPPQHSDEGDSADDDDDQESDVDEEEFL
ncbi:hypothetical protein GEMRC1_001675 [Eukaryota sp. GEM-RC1]